MRIYTMYDTVSEECGQPFLAKTEMQAKRIFQRTMKNPQLQPDDFKLLYVGEMNTDTAVITPVKPADVDISDLDFKQISELDEGLDEREE